MATKLSLLIPAAYLLGSFPSAYLVAKWARGIDIRRYGTGNVGTSNIIRVTSKRLSIPVIILDLGKGMLPVWIARMVGLEMPEQIVIGVAAIIGHNWPVFLRFKGGRGALTGAGVALMSMPKVGGILLAFALSGIPFGYFSLTTLIAFALLPVLSYFFAPVFGISQPLPVALAFSAIIVIMLVRRLAVSRTPLSASLPLREVLLNRFLFDRDIRDREAWVQQALPEKPGEGESPPHG